MNESAIDIYKRKGFVRQPDGSWSKPKAGSAGAGACAELQESEAGDSILEIPAGSWGVEHVPKGQEGLMIEITRLP